LNFARLEGLEPPTL